jgi:hypothetical protein
MNADELAALGTGPPCLFVSHEMLYAELPDVLKIVNHAHAILGSIPLIQMVQLIARKAVATEAVRHAGVHDIHTIFDPARDAGLRFDTVVASAAGAAPLSSGICATEATIHAAGSDQRGANRMWRGDTLQLVIPEK